MPSPEHDLISKTIYQGALPAVLEAGISGAHFHDDEHGRVWDWMSGHWEKYAKTPGRETLRAQYPNYILVKVPEPLEYYLDQLLKGHKRFETFDLLATAAEMAQEEDIDGALATIGERIIELEQSTSVSDDENLTKSGEQRLTFYRSIQEKGGALVGISTGFQTFDQVTGGLQAEQFTVLIGPQKAGKSSIMLRMAVAAQDSAKNVLFFGFEMTNREQGARYDGLRAGFNYNKMLHNKMTAADWKKLDKAIRAQEQKTDMIFVHDATTTLSGLAAKVHQYKPDIVFVDGVYMMDSEIPGVEAMDTRSLTKISRGLKRLAQSRKIPVVASTQALDWKWNPKQGLTTKAAGYTQAFGQDCDYMFGVEPADDENIAKLRLITGRSAVKRLIMIDFDWANGTIEERVGWEGQGDDMEDDDAETA